MVQPLLAVVSYAGSPQIPEAFQEKGSSPRGEGQAPQGMVTAPSLSEIKKHLDNALRHKGRLSVSCAEPAAGHSDPDGSLPTQDVL